jgi:hypothetical protein
VAADGPLAVLRADCDHSNRMFAASKYTVRVQS